MIPANVEYYRPGSVREALEMLQKFGDDAKVLAGGHSLIPAMRLRLSTPSHLVDIAGIPNLGGIDDDGDHITIGAGAKHSEVANSYLVGEHLNMLSEAGHMIGDVQVRNFGTIGGSLAHADPAADWPALMLASDAVIVVESLSGKREVSAADFFQGLFTTDLNDGEILTEIGTYRFSALVSSSWSCFKGLSSSLQESTLCKSRKFLVFGDEILIEI